MKHFVKFVFISLLVTAMLGHVSCSDDISCSMAGRPMVYCNLYTIDPDTRAVQKDTLDSLTITALETDSIILNNEKEVKSLILPLRYTKDTTIFVLHYDYARQPKNADTLYIVHSNTPYFQSLDCGYLMKQNIQDGRIGKGRRLSQEEHLDSIHIQSYRDANTNNTENIQLFYKYRD